MSEKEIQELLHTVQELTASVKDLTETNRELAAENVRLKQKLERMNELLLLAQRARFGQSSEKREYVLQGAEQMRLFNEAEQLQDVKAPEPTPETLVAAHTRKPKRPLDELRYLGKNPPAAELDALLPWGSIICAKFAN